jgi:hypothetical protein
MVAIWTGSRRIAVIPVWNSQVDAQPAEDWSTQVRARLLYDPDPATGIDGSLQRYIQTVSSGLAYMRATIFPTVQANSSDTVGTGLMSLPPSHGFEYAMVVIPHSFGPNRGGFAWMNQSPPTNGFSNFCRVPMFTDTGLTMIPRIGVWAMELLHTVTAFGDLYNVSPAMGNFDNMACSCGTHPSTHTKSLMGWIPESRAIRRHELNQTTRYSLHAVSRMQPPPPWRATAVWVPSNTSPFHFMIEARLGTDDYDGQSPVSSGVPSEGVVVYEVQDTTAVYLRTPTALKPGEQWEDPDEDLTVDVLGDQSDGFRIEVRSQGPDRCSELAKSIESLRRSIELEQDMFRRKQLISALQAALAEYRSRGCLRLIDPVMEFLEPPS